MPKVPNITCFALSLKYLKKDRMHEVDFLHADEHQTLLQVDTINFVGCDHSFPKYPIL